MEDTEDEKEDQMNAEETGQPSDPQPEWGEWQPPMDTLQEKEEDDNDDDVEKWIESFQKMKDLFFSLREQSQEVSEMCEDAISKFKRLKQKHEEKEREDEKRRKLDQEWAEL